MKKTYVKPSMEVYEMKQKSMILAGSDPDQWGYAPTILGAAEDEKHLA